MCVCVPKIETYRQQTQNSASSSNFVRQTNKILFLKVSVKIFLGEEGTFVVACLCTDFTHKCAAEAVNHSQKPAALNTDPYFASYLKTHKAILG